MVLCQALINFAVVLGHGADQRNSAAVRQLWRLEFARDAPGDRRAAKHFTASPRTAW